MKELIFKKDKQNWQALNYMHQEKKRDDLKSKIRNETGDVTTSITEIQKIIRDYYEQS